MKLRQLVQLRLPRRKDQRLPSRRRCRWRPCGGWQQGRSAQRGRRTGGRSAPGRAPEFPGTRGTPSGTRTRSRAGSCSATSRHRLRKLQMF